MSAQVALTVLLLVGGLLFVRSYIAHGREDKGFDSARLANVTVGLPAGTSTRQAAGDIGAAVLGGLRRHRSVVSVSRSDNTLPSTRGRISGNLRIDGRSEIVRAVQIAGYTVDPEYFETLGIRLLRGRLLQPADPPGTVVVDESFARRFWPNGDVIGARFYLGAFFGGTAPPDGKFTIVGVASHVRGDVPTTLTGNSGFVVYARIPETYSPLSFIVRLDDESRVRDVEAAVRALAPGSVVRTSLIDERYARLYGDTRVAAAITSAFGAIAFIVAMAGVYGVMAFLVAGRRREIGIRIALGAGRTDVQLLVLGPAMLFVTVGLVLGIGGSLVGSRWLEAQLFGVSPTDPLTYASVCAIVMVVALAATWRPAQRATQIDPAVTLRAE